MLESKDIKEDLDYINLNISTFKFWFIGKDLLVLVRWVSQLFFLKYHIYSCISRPFLTKKITLNLNMSYTQRPDPSNLPEVGQENQVYKTSSNCVWVSSGHSFSSAHSSSAKKFGIINFKWLKDKPTGADFCCVFWSVEWTFCLTALLLFIVLNFHFHWMITVV